MHGARAALCDATAEFCAGQADVVADDPQQRRRRIDIDRMRLAIDVERNDVISSRKGRMITVLQAAYRSKGQWRPGRHSFGLVLRQGDNDGFSES